MKKENFFMDLAKEYGSIRLENSFKDLTINPVFMKEIKAVGMFSRNQECYLQEITNRIIQYAKQGFVNGTQKISSLKISCFGIYVALYNNDPIRCIGEYNGIVYSKYLKDYCCNGRIIYPKNTIIGSINDYPFPDIEEQGIYRELLDPDKYGAPHYALDFVNKKLNETLPGHNLWAKADDLDYLSIYDLDILPHMKTY